MRLEKYIAAAANPALLLYKLSKSYIRTYEGFSYRFAKNGEARLLRKLRDFNIQTVFDVGANVGDWSEIAVSNFPNAKVHAFELSEDTFENLAKSAAAHGFKANNFGLSDQEMEITYKDYGADSTVNTIVGNADFHDQKMPATIKTGKVSTGDNYCETNDIQFIDILKIDVEGAEHMVLAGFEKMLSERRVAVIQFEYGFVNGDANFLMKDFYRLFEKWGYAVGPLKPRGVIFGDFEYRLNNFNSGPNFIAVSNDRPDLVEALRGPSINGFY